MTSVEINGHVEQSALPGLARRWFEAATTGLLADVMEGLRDGEVALPGSTPELRGRPWGDPGSMWASLTRFGTAAGRVSSRRAWSERGWEAFLKGPAKFPAGARLDLLELDSEGYSRHADRASVLLRTVDESREWFQASCEFGSFPEGPRNRIARLAEEDARQFAWALVQEVPVTYGGVGDEGTAWNGTMLEMRLARDAAAGVAQSREVLRAYPWVTVCGPEIAARLGGAGELRATGAFHEVVELPTGSVWLQATERLADYEGEALHRAFRTLAPVLPPGRPRPYVGQEAGRIVYEDARAHADS